MFGQVIVMLIDWSYFVKKVVLPSAMMPMTASFFTLSSVQQCKQVHEQNMRKQCRGVHA